MSVLLGTALLALVGFGLGIAAGLVMEQPGLLIDYLTGRTTTAPLDEARAARDVATFGTPEPKTPAAAIETASDPTPIDVDPEPVAEETASAETPAVAAPPPVAPKPEPPKRTKPEPEEDAPIASVPASKGGYSVQVGALADSAGAEALAARLRKQGFPVYVAPSAEPGSQRWRVRVGPVATRDEARALATRLEREKLPTWVLAEGPR